MIEGVQAFAPFICGAFLYLCGGLQFSVPLTVTADAANAAGGDIMQTSRKRGSFTVKVIAMLGMLTALSVVLTWLIHFPIIPAAPFLEYDPADIPILIGTFTFGPLAGLLLTIAVSAVQAFTVSAQSGAMGFLMHVFATGTMVLISGSIYKRGKDIRSAVLGLVLGALAMTAVMIPLNLIFTPLFMGAPVEAVIDLILPAILPFNLFKSFLNGAVTFILYRRSSSFIKDLLR